MQGGPPKVMIDEDRALYQRTCKTTSAIHATVSRCCRASTDADASEASTCSTITLAPFQTATAESVT